MTSLIKIAFAHSGEEHVTVAESGTHYLEMFLSPQIAIPTFFVVLGIVIFVMNKMKAKYSHIALTVLVLTFVVAVLGLIFVPPLGIVALSIGFVLALSFVLVGVRNQ